MTDNRERAREIVHSNLPIGCSVLPSGHQASCTTWTDSIAAALDAAEARPHPCSTCGGSPHPDGREYKARRGFYLDEDGNLQEGEYPNISPGEIDQARAEGERAWREKAEDAERELRAVYTLVASAAKNLTDIAALQRGGREGS